MSLVIKIEVFSFYIYETRETRVQSIFWPPCLEREMMIMSLFFLSLEITSRED